MQEPEKYINHSCNPTVYVKAENGMRNVYAMRNIKKMTKSPLTTLLMVITKGLSRVIVEAKLSQGISR